MEQHLRSQRSQPEKGPTLQSMNEFMECKDETETRLSFNSEDDQKKLISKSIIKGSINQLELKSEEPIQEIHNSRENGIRGRSYLEDKVDEAGLSQTSEESEIRTTGNCFEGHSKRPFIEFFTLEETPKNLKISEAKCPYSWITDSKIKPERIRSQDIPVRPMKPLGRMFVSPSKLLQKKKHLQVPRRLKKIQKIYRKPKKETIDISRLDRELLKKRKRDISEVNIPDMFRECSKCSRLLRREQAAEQYNECWGYQKRQHSRIKDWMKVDFLCPKCSQKGKLKLYKRNRKMCEDIRKRFRNEDRNPNKSFFVGMLKKYSKTKELVSDEREESFESDLSEKSFQNKRIKKEHQFCTEEPLKFRKRYFLNVQKEPFVCYSARGNEYFNYYPKENQKISFAAEKLTKLRPTRADEDCDTDEETLNNSMTRCVLDLIRAIDKQTRKLQGKPRNWRYAFN